MSKKIEIGERGWRRSLVTVLILSQHNILFKDKATDAAENGGFILQPVNKKSKRNKNASIPMTTIDGGRNR